MNYPGTNFGQQYHFLTRSLVYTPFDSRLIIRFSELNLQSKTTTVPVPKIGLQILTIKLATDPKYMYYF